MTAAGPREDNVIRLQRHPGGVASGLRTRLCAGRYEIATAGPNPEFGFVGSDAYDTNAYTGLVVPSTPSAAIGGARYLFLLARASFQTGQQGVRLVGIRQYAEAVARIPAGTSPLTSTSPPPGSPVGSTVTFRREIKNALWHPPDGSISWHVMIVSKGRRDTRNPANADGLIYQDAKSPALLYQSLAPYVPPNGGRPWGRPIGASLGNIHEMRYPWRTDQSERTIDIPLPLPCDVALFASVRQNDPTTNPILASGTAMQFAALMPEDRFLTAYSAFAQYGSIAGALVFDLNLGEDQP
jgi:hypothetical protein